MSRLRPQHLALGLAAGSLLAVTACGTTQPSQAEEGQQDAAAGGPVTLTDQLGREVELPAPAEDVVSLEWQQTEDLLTLGVEPVGAADVEGYNTWNSAEPLSEDVTDVGMRGEPNLQAINELAPDLILLEVTAKSDVKRFDKLDVPVLAFWGADTQDPIGNMKEIFTLIAEATGTQDQADDVLAEFDATLDEAKQQIADLDLETTRFAFIDAYAEGSTVSIRPFGQGSLVGELGEAIGLKNVWKGKVDEVYGLGQTDVEGITAIGDAHLLYTGTESETWLKPLERNPLWKNAEFTEHEFTDGIWTFGGPRSSEQVVEEFVSALGA